MPKSKVNNKHLKFREGNKLVEIENKMRLIIANRSIMRIEGIIYNIKKV
jgi:hypothetical protein